MRTGAIHATGWGAVVLAAAAWAAADGPAPLAVPAHRTMENRAFGVGERLQYQVHFSGVSGGTVVQEVVSIESLAGRPAYRVVSEARTNKTFDLFHRTRDRNESWIDVQNLSSLKYVESIEEGSYRKRAETVVDASAGRLQHTYKTTKHEGQTSVDVPPFPQDAVSIVYFLRVRPLRVGDVFDLPTYSGGEVYRSTVRVGEMEKVKVPAGVFQCYHVVPSLDGDGKQKNQIEVWLSTGPERWPVLLKSRLTFGSFTARLTDRVPGRIEPPPASVAQ
jgi:hypothetical protein